MNCVFCEEPLPEGTRVCRSCGGRQHAASSRNRQPVFFVVVLFAVMAIGVYFTFATAKEREAAINDARAAALFCQKMTADEGQDRVEQLHAEGASWPDAAKAFRSLIGCSPR